MPLNAEIREVLGRFDPSSRELFERLRKRVDDSMLAEIAVLDYGWHAEENLEALRRILETGTVSTAEQLPRDAHLHPWEVCRLTNSDLSIDAGDLSERDHLKRACCCAILIAPENAGRIGHDNQTVALLTQSAVELGTELEAAALRYLCWILGEMGRLFVDDLLFSLAALILAVHLRSIDEEGILRLSKWLVVEEQRFRYDPDQLLPEDTDGWLLGLTWYRICHPVWTRLTSDVLVPSIHDGMSAEAQVALRDLAQRLLSGPAWEEA